MMVYIFIYIFIVGCSGDLNQTCPGYYLDMEAPSLNIDENGYYHMTFLNDYVQTFSVLEAETGSNDEYQKVGWITNKEILIDGYWTNLINPSSSFSAVIPSILLALYATLNEPLEDDIS